MLTPARLHPHTSIFNLLFSLILVLVVVGCQESQSASVPTPAQREAVAPISQPATKSPILASTATPTSPDTPQSGAPHPRPLLLAHYMPWYQAPPTSSSWGWHWTMDHFKPGQTNAQGRPEIASHYTPLTGPYDSRDEALLEYHVLLMKLSGIDGVIVDWYGSENFWDYGIINNSTHKLFQFIKKADLLFVICYEDQTVKHMVDNKRLAAKNAHGHGQEEMRYLQETWFGDETYLKAFDRPVLFTFGPQYFKAASDWETLFSVLDPPPVFITLDQHTAAAAASSFPWPPMWASEGGVLNQPALERYLTGFYEKAESWDYVVTGAFPGFHDIYQEAGVGPSYGYLDARQGETFRFTLNLALEQDPDIIQLITWNDYGEGTIIEPTQEFGYQYLEMVQAARQGLTQRSKFPFESEALPLPLQLFNLRKKYARNLEVNAHLDEAFQALIAGELEVAAMIMAVY